MSIALDKAQAEYEAAVAERKRLDPRGLKAREELAEAALLEAQEIETERVQRTSHDLFAAKRRVEEAQAAHVAAMTAFTDSREELSAAEAEYTKHMGQARRLRADGAQIDIPVYTTLPILAVRDNELRRLVDRTQRAILNGLW